MSVNIKRKGLGIPYWVSFKVLVLTNKALYGLVPVYRQDHLSARVPPSVLQLESQNLLILTGPKDARLAKMRTRAFLVAAPHWWNEMPKDMRALWDLLQFYKTCKMEFFSQAFDWDASI